MSGQARPADPAELPALPSRDEVAASFLADETEVVAGLTAHSHVPPLVLGWLIAALIRLSTGSATVSITTAAGIVAPMIVSMPGVNVELMVIAMGAGSIGHVPAQLVERLQSGSGA